MEELDGGGSLHVDTTAMEVDGGGVDSSAGEATGEREVVVEEADVPQSPNNSSSNSTVIVPEVGYRFMVFEEYEVEPYCRIKDIEWEVTFVEGQQLFAKAIYPDSAKYLYTNRNFSDMHSLVCTYIKDYQ